MLAELIFVKKRSVASGQHNLEPSHKNGTVSDLQYPEV